MIRHDMTLPWCRCDCKFWLGYPHPPRLGLVWAGGGEGMGQGIHPSPPKGILTEPAQTGPGQDVPYPPVDRIVHMGENITFPRTTVRGQ